MAAGSAWRMAEPKRAASRVGSMRRPNFVSEPRERACFRNVQAITDQYAEKVLGDRGHFLNKPYVVD